MVTNTSSTRKRVGSHAVLERLFRLCSIAQHQNLRVGLVCWFLVSILAAHPCLGADRPNVLLIAIDDMNDWIGCLNGHPDARSPHIDRLAKRGTLFTNAHCQAPICNPSRTSIMYGVRPSTSGVYFNDTRPWTQDSLKNQVTLPKHFAANGYTTYTAGKIYHGSRFPKNEFQIVGPRPGQRQKIDARIVPESKEKGAARGLWDFGPQDYAEEKFGDHVVATWVTKKMKDHASRERSKPFFIAAGFYRPHVPLYSPTRVFSQIPKKEIDLPVVKLDDRDDLPSIVDEVTIPPVAPKHDWFLKTNRWKDAVQSYLSCIRFTDEQVGRLIDELDATELSKNTIVVLFSDHGFFLGEKQRWAKQSLWERATRVPFIVVLPKHEPARCEKPVELLSIYPTLVELCGLSKSHGIEGHSLVPLLKNAEAEWPYQSFTTHGRGNHTVRTSTHRYIRYRDGSEELYDVRSDPHEWNNLASETGYDVMKANLAKLLPNDRAISSE